MKPAPFRYIAPSSMEEALSNLHEHGSEAKLLAGGQSLIPALNFRCLKPAVVIDLNPLPYLDTIQKGAEGDLLIGAMTRYQTLEFNPTVLEFAPLMHHAAPYIAHTAIRSRGTMGGSLAYADPAAEMPAVTLALDARYKAISTRGERWIHAEDFFQDMFFTALEPDEILVEISLPALPERTYWAFHEVARRHGDRVLAGTAAVVTVNEDGTCRKVNLVYLNAARTPFKARRADKLLVGSRGTPDVIEAAARMAQEEVTPEDDVHATADFRRHLVAELTRRTLGEIFARIEKELIR
jgi:aerobic carbon-monoxide dehydrogenase medium subunit